MKSKNQNMIDCELRVKSTANLRKQIISELTQPDKSLINLLERETDDSNNETQLVSSGENDT